MLFPPEPAESLPESATHAQRPDSDVGARQCEILQGCRRECDVVRRRCPHSDDGHEQHDGVLLHARQVEIERGDARMRGVKRLAREVRAVRGSG